MRVSRWKLLIEQVCDIEYEDEWTSACVYASLMSECEILFRWVDES